MKRETEDETSAQKTLFDVVLVTKSFVFICKKKLKIGFTLEEMNARHKRLYFQLQNI